MDCFFPLSSSFGVCLFPLFVLYFCLLILPNSLGFFYAASRPVMAPGLGEAALCRRRPVFLVFHLFPLCLLVFSMLLVPVLVSSWPISTLSLLVTRTICSRAAPMWAACTLLLRHSQILWAASSTDPPLTPLAARPYLVWKLLACCRVSLGPSMTYTRVFKLIQALRVGIAFSP